MASERSEPTAKREIRTDDNEIRMNNKGDEDEQRLAQAQPSTIAIAKNKSHIIYAKIRRIEAGLG